MRKALFDHSKLKGLAREKGETLASLSKKTGISTGTLSNKWNGKGYFNSAEIYALSVVLGIEDPRPYFFKLNS